jgi:hypothetical protein
MLPLHYSPLVLLMGGERFKQLEYTTEIKSGYGQEDDVLQEFRKWCDVNDFLRTDTVEVKTK